MGALHSLRSLAQAFTDTVLDLLYPPACLSCGADVLSGRERVCSACWQTVEVVSRDQPLYLETREKLVEGGVSDLCSAFVFEKDGALQKILHALKYDGSTIAGVELGTKVGAVLTAWGIRADCIVPVPLHRRKERERGYNQAEHIARGVSQVTGWSVETHLLVRTRFTQTQTQLNREERKGNVQDAFAVVKKNVQKIEGRTILILDDVITTGATITACANALLSANATRVIAASVALAK